MNQTKALGVVAFLFATAGACFADPLMTQSDAFDYGKGTGSEANVQSFTTGITDAQAGSVIGGYDPNALPAGAAPYDGSLLGTLTTAGSSKISNCGGGNAGGTDQASLQHCEAVNAVNQQATMPPQTVLNNSDPMFTVGNAIKNNPEAIAGSMVGNYSSCTTQTISSAASSSEEACTDYSTLGSSNCSTGTQVVIDPDHFYKCVETIKTQSSSYCVVGQKIVVDGDTNYQCQTVDHTTTRQTCQIQRVPTVTQNMVWNCTPGAWSAQVGSGCLTGDCDQVSFAAYCNVNGIPQIGVFAAGVWRENWGRNCATGNSGRMYSFDADGFGSYAEGSNYSTNFHKCDNGCCFAWRAVSIVGNGCTGNTCSATAKIYASVTGGVYTLTLSYPKPTAISYTYSMAENNQCSVFESRL